MLAREFKKNEPDMNVYIYVITLPWVGCDSRTIFKRAKAGLNSEFFFCWLVAIPKVKISVCPTI